MLMCFNTMWRSTRHQRTWIQLGVFTFMYSFLGFRYAHSNEYYIRRGYKNSRESDLYLKEDVFGYPKRPASLSCSAAAPSFNSEPFTPEISWPRNIPLCTNRCGRSANTFLPEEDTCLSNTRVRTRFGKCMALFSGESPALFVLDVNNNSIVQALQDWNIKPRCQVDANGQHYYSGNGIWKNISTSGLSFYIHRKKLMWNSTNATLYMGRIIKLQLKNCRKKSWPNDTNECILFKAKGNYHYQTFVTSTVKFEPSPTPSMSHQRILHVTISLTSTSYVKVSHSLASPNVTSEQPCVVMTPTSTSHVVSSASPNVTTMALPPLIPSTSEQASVVMTLVNTPTTSAQTEGPTTPYFRSKGGSSQEKSNTESILVGVITTCVIVMIISLLVAVLCKRRSNNKSRSSLKATNTSVDNPSYQKNKDQIIPLSSAKKRPQVDEDYDNTEYDYAAVDGVQVHTGDDKKQQPVYQSLDRGNENPQIYQSLISNPDLNKPDNADSKDYSYNHLQHPKYNPPHPKNTSDPLYNSLQKPGSGDDYLEPGTQICDNHTGVSEPVYNVLEGPDANPPPQDNDPVYNVLEDPNANQYTQDNDPVYNVLEDPNANQYTQDDYPVYNVLEDPDDNYDNAPIDDDQNLPASGQDNVAYSSTIDLKMPQSPSSPDYDVLEGPDGALPDSTYQPLGIRVQDDVYQPLDRTSQSIYQSLEPNDSTA